uniref:Uncharacterized protein n=1 Tax=Helianthus annuus TaxID=4232 RepID=A0A251UUJ0_HELAN
MGHNHGVSASSLRFHLPHSHSACLHEETLAASLRRNTTKKLTIGGRNFRVC